MGHRSNYGFDWISQISGGKQGSIQSLLLRSYLLWMPTLFLGFAITTRARTWHWLCAMLGPYAYWFCQTLCCFAGRLWAMYVDENGYYGAFLGFCFAVRICYGRQTVVCNVSVDTFCEISIRFHNTRLWLWSLSSAAIVGRPFCI